MESQPPSKMHANHNKKLADTDKNKERKYREEEKHCRIFQSLQLLDISNISVSGTTPTEFKMM